MRMKYGIGFFGVMIMALTLMAGAYQLSFKKAQERRECGDRKED